MARLSIEGGQVRRVRLRTMTATEEAQARSQKGAAYEELVREGLEEHLRLSPARILQFDVWSRERKAWETRIKEIDIVAVNDKGVPILIVEVSMVGTASRRLHRQVDFAAALLALNGIVVRRAIVLPPSLKPRFAAVRRTLGEVPRLDWPRSQCATVELPRHAWTQGSTWAADPDESFPTLGSLLERALNP